MRIKLSRSQWEYIGKRAGWVQKFSSLSGEDLTKIKNFIKKLFPKKEDTEIEKIMDRMVKGVGDNGNLMDVIQKIKDYKNVKEPQWKVKDYKKVQKPKEVKDFSGGELAESEVDRMSGF